MENGPGRERRMRDRRRIYNCYFRIETLFTLQTVSADEVQFVKFWAPIYRDDLEDVYDNNISVKPLTEKAINALFAWKNSGRLSEPKQASVARNYISRREEDCVKRAVAFPQSSDAIRLKDFAEKFLIADFPKGERFGEYSGFTAAINVSRFTTDMYIEQ